MASLSRRRGRGYRILTIGIAIWMTVVIVAGFVKEIPWLGPILGSG